MAKSKHYGPAPTTEIESFANFDKDKETEKENGSSSKSYGASNETSNGASASAKSYGSTNDSSAPKGVDTVNGEKYEEIIDSEDEANAKAAAEAIQAIRGTPGSE